MSLLDPVLKKAWVEDLRAHPERQGHERLCRVAPDGDFSHYCCLGRLAKLKGIEDSLLEGLQWLPSHLPNLLPEPVQKLLASMNDGGLLGVNVHSAARGAGLPIPGAHPAGKRTVTGQFPMQFYTYAQIADYIDQVL